MTFDRAMVILRRAAVDAGYCVQQAAEVAQAQAIVTVALADRTSNLERAEHAKLPTGPLGGR